MWLWELKDLAVIGVSVLLSIVILTQSEYDALPVKDPGTVYIIR